MENRYILVNGTSYLEGTPEKVIKVLENCRLNRIRIVLDYGDIETNTSWGEKFDVTGYINRSNGSEKVPILLHNARSIGGPCILIDCILSIKTSKGKVVLYQSSPKKNL